MRQSSQEIKAMIKEALDERFDRNVIGLTPGYHLPSGLTIGADGRVLYAQPNTIYSAKAHRTSAVSISSGGETRMDWQAAAWNTSDTAIWTSGNPSRLIAPVTGYYLLSVSIMWAWASGPGTEMTLGDRLIRVFRRAVSGSTVQDWSFPRRALSSVDYIAAYQAELQLKLNANQYVEVYVSQNSGSTLYVSGSPDMSHAVLTLLGQ